MRLSIALQRLWPVDLYRSAWRLRSPSAVRFCKATQRAIFTNILLFRQSGSLIARRFRERFPTHHSLRFYENRLHSVQHVLIAGCFLSFAQDKITDDEILNCTKGFSCTEAEEDCVIPVQSYTEPEASNTNNLCDTSPSTEQLSPDPPLTLFVRRLRADLFRYASGLLSGDVKELTDHCELKVEHLIPEHQPVETNNLVNAQLKAALSSIDLNLDGQGFVDETWELIVDRPLIRAWRRPLSSSQPTSGTTDDSCPPSDEPTLYEYRMCGTMNDVSASSFLEVQLNLQYRNQWDKKVVFLDYALPSTASNSGQPSSGSDIIRWVARFPFPMADREYFYARRWWLEEDGSDTKLESSDDQKQSRHALVVSRSCPSFANSSDGHQKEQTRAGWSRLSLRGEVVPVVSYRSEMLIKSHGDFSELGLDYYLAYFDNPRLPIGQSLRRLLPQKKLLDGFMTQLHSAAATIDKAGLPHGVEPVSSVYRRQRKSSSSSTSPPPPVIIHSVATSDQRSAGNDRPMPKPASFFSDVTPDPSTTSYQ